MVQQFMFADTESIMWNSCGRPNKSTEVFDCCYWGWSCNTCSSEYYSYASSGRLWAQLFL